MTGLLADGWFYISSAGLLVSGVLFFFLLGQYRAATDAADQPEPEAAAEPQSPIVRPLFIPDEPASSLKIASVTSEKTAEKASPKTPPATAEPRREAAPAPAEARRETTTGTVNPAVVYLQNIKNELEEIHRETRDLAKRVEAITGRDEALIDRLSELTQAVAELKSANPPAPAESAAPKRAKKSEAPPAAVSVVKTEVPAAAPPASAIEPTTVSGVPETKPEPKPEPEPIFTADDAASVDLKPAEEAQPAPAEAITPAAEASEEPESGEKPRRGPVWPV